MTSAQVRLRWSPCTQPFYVEKGTVVYSTAPNWPSEGRPARRSYTVHATTDPGGQKTWPGGSGYWRWVRPTTEEA